MLMSVLPDVTSDRYSDILSTLQWVGMENIAVPIFINLQNSHVQSAAAKANVYVSLDKPEAKGIHMSRLHNVINQLATKELNLATTKELLEEIIHSQEGIGKEARIELTFDALLSKPSLLSNERGFQSYPVTIRAEKKTVNSEQKIEAFSSELTLVIPYSSTCPCSASLAQQLYANAINEEFAGPSINKAELIQWIESKAGVVATPHSQRSYAYIRLSIGANDWPNLAALIFQLEEVIGTPVQTAVKRVDEQAFAKLNAENLMFCEDAARRIKHALEDMRFVQDYWFKVEHQESLHAHDAVVVDQKYPTSSTR
jgi:GTP cyclohydrolase I